MQAIVLAGNKAADELQELGVSHVFLLKSEGRTLLEIMCSCLLEGGGCDAVYVRAPVEIDLPDLPGVSRLEPNKHVIQDVLDAFRDRLDAPAVFVGAADVPLITPQAIEALRDYSETVGADFTYPVVSREEMEQQYPGTKRTYLPFSGTKFTGGNVMVFNREWLLDKQELVEFMFENRKNPLALISRFGLLFMLKIAIGMATIDDAERTVSRMSDGKVVAARLPFPEIALDLDKVSDLEFFRPYLD